MELKVAWLRPEDAPTLVAGTVHVWRLYLGLDAPSEQRARALLSPDELQRADRYRAARARRNFVLARAGLRALLGRYTGTPAQELRFVYGEFGKPELADSSTTKAIRFNLSHSADWALIGVTTGAEIGVDIERRRRMKDMDSVADHWFSDLELKTYYSQSDAMRALTFYRAWTRKEAYIKAIGTGMSYPSKNFDIEIGPGSAARILRIEGDTAAAGGWTLFAFEPAVGYLGAAAVRGTGFELRCFDLEPRG